MVVKTEEIRVLTLEDLENPNMGFVIAPLHTFNQRWYSILSLPNQRTFYTIVYFEEDGGQFAIDKSVVEVQKGEVMSIDPFSVCRYKINKEAKGWILLFTDVFFTKRYNDNVLFDFTFLKDNAIYRHLDNIMDVPRWRVLLDAMYDEIKRSDIDSKTILRSYLNITLGMLDRCNGIRINNPYNRERENKVRAFEQSLEQYYKRKRFPSFYAEKLNISTNYLNRICRERRNKSAGELIRERILMEAERLLYHTFKTVSEIAFELGFDSSSYFITFFKKKYGISPEEFRKKQR